MVTFRGDMVAPNIVQRIVKNIFNRTCQGVSCEADSK